MSVCNIYYKSFFFFSFLMFMMSINFMLINYTLILELNLVSINSCGIMMVILLDWMSLLFMSFVLFISSMVILYSKEYMENDISMSRFIMLVFMFVMSMMLLIISPNIISILLGWDGLGLVSYCLVIYYQNLKSYNAGMITALTNRIGDVALLMAIAWMMNYGSFNYYLYLDWMMSDKSMEIVVLLVILAAFTKSAQIPFSSWLPAAMAAPTPVSSLVHSSTLVTAGVYLLIRFNLAINSNFMMLILFVGTMTMFMAGLGANYEFDLKKIIALSTLSQLGLMMSILSLGEYELAFFHMLIHALFKALLFMCAGSMIHNFNNCQDIRYMGSMIMQMPLTVTIFIISNLSLCGFPFFSGFYSKDLILEVLSMNYLNLYIYIMFFVSTGLTVSYTFRLIYYSIVGDYSFLSLSLINDTNFIMLKGMIGLIFFVIMSGSILMWLLFLTPYFICLPKLMKMMALLVSLMGMWLGYELSKFALSYTLFSKKMYMSSMFFSTMWNMPYITTYGVNYYPVYMGNQLYKIMDQGWSEFLGSQNIFYMLKNNSLLLQVLYNNNLKIFMLMTVLWVMFLGLYL